MAMKIPNGISKVDGRLYATAYQIIKSNDSLRKMSASNRMKWCEGFANGVHFTRSNEGYLNKEVFENESSSNSNGDGLQEVAEADHEDGRKPNNEAADTSSARRRGIRLATNGDTAEQAASES